MGLQNVGFSIRFQDSTRDKSAVLIKYTTDGALLRELCRQDRLLSTYGVVMIDEANERTHSTDLLFPLVRDIARIRKDLKVIISSSLPDDAAIKFCAAPIFKIPDTRYPVDICYSPEPEKDYVEAAILTVLKIHEAEPPGDVLLFLPGQEEIKKVHELLIEKFRANVAELVICPFYTSLPTELQSKVFLPTPLTARKLILTTDIAETSIAVQGVRYVVDPGFRKMKSYCQETGMESSLICPISKASAMQRAFRSGITGPGKCFRLYTKHSYEQDLQDRTIPEIQRTNLAGSALLLKSAGFADLTSFDFIDRPPVEAIRKANEHLFLLEALDERGELTEVGRKMAEFPVEPMLSKAIVASQKYQCAEEIVTIASMLSVGDSVFYRPGKDEQVNADNARMKFHRGDVGDHIALLNVYNSWRESSYSSDWCCKNYVKVQSMERARDAKDKLVSIMERVGIKLSSNLGDLDAVRKAIASGFFLHTAKLQSRIEGYKSVENSGNAHIHPSSGLAEVFPEFVVYHQLFLSSKDYMKQVTEVKPEWLVEIAPRYRRLSDLF